MPKLLSSKTLRRGGSGEFIDLKGAMPQLPPTPTTSTGYTLVTNDTFQTEYRSSLGNVEVNGGEFYSNLPGQNIKLFATDTTQIVVSGSVVTVNTNTGALVVEGGIGVWGGIHTGEDIVVNDVRIGQGYEGTNNIVVKGTALAETLGDNNGQHSIVIGYDALNGLTTGYKNVAIGRYALSSGTNISRSVAIGDSALSNIGVYQTILAGNITNVSLTDPVVVTAPGHNVTSGTAITIFNVDGTTELNGNTYYAWVQSTSTIALYSNINLTTSVDGTGFTAYVNSGTVEINTKMDDNIAIGINAGKSLIDGEQNLFWGDDIAKNITTGSYNIFIGHDVANNMITGNANISIGGDNLVDGQDNQINIGSVFYYNGTGTTFLTSNLETGDLTTAVPTKYSDDIFTATQTNPVQITTFINGFNTGTRIVINNVVGMTELNGQIYYTSYVGTDTNNYHVAELYVDVDLTQPVDGTGFGAFVSDGTVLLLKPNGAVSINGGVGIHGNLIVSDQVDVYSGMWVKHLITGTITTATNIEGGVRGDVPYQSGTGTTALLPIGAFDTVLTSDGSVPVWQTLGSITVGGAIDADNAFIHTVTPEVTYYLTLDEAVGTYTSLVSDVSLTYITTTATTSTYFVTGTSVLNVPGSVYAMEGYPEENYLLYTPRVTVSNTPPSNPRLGDFWINAVTGYELQYIEDGGNRFWIQFTSL